MNIQNIQRSVQDVVFGLAGVAIVVLAFLSRSGLAIAFSILIAIGSVLDLHRGIRSIIARSRNKEFIALYRQFAIKLRTGIRPFTFIDETEKTVVYIPNKKQLLIVTAKTEYDFDELNSKVITTAYHYWLEPGCYAVRKSVNMGIKTEGSVDTDEDERTTFQRLTLLQAIRSGMKARRAPSALTYADTQDLQDAISWLDACQTQLDNNA